MDGALNRVTELKFLSNAYGLIDKYCKDIGNSIPDEELDIWIKKIIRIGDPLGIIINDEIIAFLLLYCNKYDILEAYICNVYVKEGNRGRGLSKLLVNQAIRICHSRGFRTIKLDVAINNAPAIRVYSQCGFFETERYLKGFEPFLKMTYNL